MSMHELMKANEDYTFDEEKRVWTLLMADDNMEDVAVEDSDNEDMQISMQITWAAEC